MGCARMTLELTLPNPQIETSVGGGGNINALAVNEASASYSRQKYEVELSAIKTNDAGIDTERVGNADIIVSFVCATNIGDKLILMDKNGIPIITIDDKYIYLEQ